MGNTGDFGSPIPGSNPGRVASINSRGSKNKMARRGKKKITISKARGGLYKAARILGDIDALSKGKVGRRITRRVAGKLTGRGLRKATSGLPNCFIATVVYGVDAKEVEILRNYRDSVLSRSQLGKKVVALYYSGIGKRIAELIEKYFPFLIPFIRKGLDCIIARYSKWIEKM